MAKSRVPLSPDQVITSVPPTKSSYWVVQGKLLAGAYPKAADLAQLKRVGVNRFIDLTESGEEEPYQHLVGASEAFHVPIQDMCAPTLSDLSSILAMIDESLERRRVCYVHCLAGVGRTGLVVACWMLKCRMTNGEWVFHELQRLRSADATNGYRTAPQSNVQRQFVQDYGRK